MATATLAHASAAKRESALLGVGNRRQWRCSERFANDRAGLRLHEVRTFERALLKKIKGWVSLITPRVCWERQRWPPELVYTTENVTAPGNVARLALPLSPLVLLISKSGLSHEPGKFNESNHYVALPCKAPERQDRALLIILRVQSRKECSSLPLADTFLPQIKTSSSSLCKQERRRQPCRVSIALALLV